MKAITLDQLYFSYDTQTQILGPIDARIELGHLTAILGPSGCGKSTLLRLIAGLLQPSAGAVHNPFTGSQIGFVFQDPTLLSWANVLENAALPLRLARLSQEECLERAHNALKKVGLDAYCDFRPHQLSGGMRMRLSLARALIGDPFLILLDEPFAALDEITRNRLDEELRDLIEESGKTAVFVTHNVSEAVFLADYVIVMQSDPGQVIQIEEIDFNHSRNAGWRATPIFHKICQSLTSTLERAS